MHDDDNNLTPAAPDPETAADTPTEPAAPASPATTRSPAADWYGVAPVNPEEAICDEEDNAEDEDDDRVDDYARIAPPAPPHSRRTGWIVALCVIGGALLLVLLGFALRMLFSAHGGYDVSDVAERYGIYLDIDDGEDNGSHTPSLPGTDRDDAGSDSSHSDSDSFPFAFYGYGYDYDGDDEDPIDPDISLEDFFDAYYTSKEVSIPTAALTEGRTLDFAEASGEELTLQEIYDTVSPAVVGIYTYLDGSKYAWGTGIIFSADGYILTNEHVLESADAAEVVLTDGTVYEAALVGSDAATDIAVLKIDAAGLPYAVFSDSSSVRVGDEVVAIGNPLSDTYFCTMTNGIISAIDRNVTYNGSTMTLLQTNAAINEGNSGGPLIDRYGRIIGITNMKIMSVYYTSVEGIGFAIPSAVVKSVTDQLLASGVVTGTPTIGITAGSIPAIAQSHFNLPEGGVYVSEVNEASDAYAQGLQKGDIILEVEGVAVASVDEVNAVKAGYAVGDSLDLYVWRDGETFTLTIRLVDKADIR